MIARGVIDVDELIREVAQLSEGSEWFRKLNNREADLLKVLLTP